MEVEIHGIVYKAQGAVVLDVEDDYPTFDQISAINILPKIRYTQCTLLAAVGTKYSASGIWHNSKEKRSNN